MAERSKGREPQLARTDFESMTHEQLAAMLASASTAGASHLSSKLSKAASAITKIGDDLMGYVKGLEWQGEAGDTFRDWGGQTASSTLRLGQYAEVASRWMGTVSQAIADAKAAMPDVSETTAAKTDLANAHETLAATRQPGSHNDPDAQRLARTAHTDAAAAEKRIEAARAEAIQQMRKLAQTYEYSAQQVTSVTPPTFPPPAQHMGKDWIENSEHVSVGSGDYAAATKLGSGGQAAGGGTPVQHTVTSHISAPHIAGSATPTPVHGRQPVPHERPVEMGIDGVDTLPRTPTPNTTGPTVAQPGIPRPEVPVPGQQPTTLPPVFTSGSPVPGTSSGSRTPSQSRFPQTTVPGGVSTGRVPQLSSPGGVSTGRPPQLPRETGIVGGRPVSSATGRPQSGIPRGTVIGREGVQGRTGMAKGGQGSGVGGAGSASGMAGGRRLASEAGGIVGNRLAQPGRSGGRPFTQGGSGLVRASSSEPSTARGPANGRKESATSTDAGGSSRKDRQQGERPDYAVEDEETWSTNSRRSVPPVVE
ncbi:WXG100 family type VII secretion target [Streptomyces sp. NPDC014006]|uniref:WXG100 family type VII secretion target n=1 Tax=Streptomyces sp. NPDC014006 TaxID=3364870 RepID=UPI0036FBC978